MTNPLDYDQLVLLDAENLAEDGIKEAYDSLLAELTRFVPEPVQIQEVLDNQAPSYVVVSGETEYAIYGPELSNAEGRSWGRATYAFFAIVNAQLESTDVRFYAINGGNDLGGMFLTEEQVSEARQALPRPSDWPYIPTPEHPYYGQHY